MSHPSRLIVRTLAWHSLINFLGALVGATYALITLVPKLPEALRLQSLIWAISAFFASSLVVGPLLILYSRLPASVADRLSRGVEVSQRERSVAGRKALHLPLLAAATAFVIWVVCAATLPLTFETATLSARNELTHAVVAVVLVGFVTFTCELNVLELDVQRHMIPRVLGTSPATSIPGAYTLSLGARLGLLLLTTCVLPVTVLTVTTVRGVVSAPGTLFLGVTFLALSVLQGKFIADRVGRPLSTLIQAMAQVQREDLSASVQVVSSDALGRLGDGFNQMVEGLRRGRVVKETFGRYLAPQVVEEILGGKIALGGEERQVTVLFSDIRGFTAMSEDLPPSEVVRFLNQFLDRMVEVLTSHGATIDKFIGDAVMATFGVPLSKGAEADARSAVRAALEMVRVLEQWNAERAVRGEPPLKIGIGLHSGEVVAGNIGSARKTEYTVIGDTVNTASRIESLTRQYDVPVLISEQTRALLGDELRIDELAPAEVKGKKLPLRIFAVRELAETQAKPRAASAR